MRERVYGGRIGEVIGGYVDGLDRGDGTAPRVGNALLEGRQLGGHGWLVAQARGHLTHQTRHLRAGLDEPEDVVDEQQHVPVLVVAEIFGHGQRRVSDSKATAGRLVHLAEYHHHVGEHAGLLHIAVQLLTLAAALADAAEYADAV